MINLVSSGGERAARARDENDSGTGYGEARGKQRPGKNHVQDHGEDTRGVFAPSASLNRAETGLSGAIEFGTGVGSGRRIYRPASEPAEMAAGEVWSDDPAGERKDAKWERSIGLYLRASIAYTCLPDDYLIKKSVNYVVLIDCECLKKIE